MNEGYEGQSPDFKPLSTPQPRARPAHDVHVQVVHLLATLGPVVHHDPETAIGIGVATLLQSELRGQGHHVAHQARMFRSQVHHRRDVQLGDDQEMNGSPGIDVVEREDVLVFVHLARGNLARNDFAKNTVGVGHGLLEMRKRVQSVTGRCAFKRTMP